MRRRNGQRVFSNNQFDQRVKRGLVGHWTGGGSGNTWIDQGGYGNHGSLTNGPTWTLGEGNKRNCLKFDGTDDYVSIPGTARLGLTTYTLTAWINPIILDANYHVIIAKKGSPDATGAVNYWMGLDASTNRLGFYHYLDGAHSQSVFSTFVPPLNQWTHVAISVSGTTLRIYANGVLVNTTTLSSPSVADSESVSIGRYGSISSQYFNGRIDDVRIYNRELSSAEISLLASPSFYPLLFKSTIGSIGSTTGNPGVSINPSYIQNYCQFPFNTRSQRSI